jgi:hypothetical protein
VETDVVRAVALAVAVVCGLPALSRFVQAVQQRDWTGALALGMLLFLLGWFVQWVAPAQVQRIWRSVLG